MIVPDTPEIVKEKTPKLKPIKIYISLCNVALQIEADGNNVLTGILVTSLDINLDISRIDAVRYLEILTVIKDARKIEISSDDSVSTVYMPDSTHPQDVPPYTPTSVPVQVYGGKWEMSTTTYGSI